MTTPARIYASARPSHPSAPVAPMDEEDRLFFELRRNPVPSTSEYLRLRGLSR